MAAQASVLKRRAGGTTSLGVGGTASAAEEAPMRGKRKEEHRSGGDRHKNRKGNREKETRIGGDRHTNRKCQTKETPRWARGALKGAAVLAMAGVPADGSVPTFLGTPERVTREGREGSAMLSAPKREESVEVESASSEPTARSLAVMSASGASWSVPPMPKSWLYASRGAEGA